MTREVRLLLIVLILVLLMTAAMAIPLGAAPPFDDETGTPTLTEESLSETPPVTTTVAISTTTPSPLPTAAPTSTSTSTPTPTPTPTSTPSVTPSPVPSPSPLPTATIPPSPPPPPTETALPSPSPAPTPPPTPSPVEEIIGWVKDHIWLPIALGALLTLLLLGGVLAVALSLARRRPLPSPPPPVSPPLPRLEWTDAAGKTLSFPLKPDGFLIGRGKECNLVIGDEFPSADSVSRCHARIFEKEGRWIVADLSSTNGVYVNGKRTGRNLLRDGDRLRFGAVEFIFRIESGEARP